MNEISSDWIQKFLSLKRISIGLHDGLIVNKWQFITWSRDKYIKFRYNPFK